MFPALGVSETDRPLEGQGQGPGQGEPPRQSWLENSQLPQRKLQLFGKILKTEIFPFKIAPHCLMGVVVQMSHAPILLLGLVSWTGLHSP